MNFNKSKHCVKGKEVIVQKKEDIKGVQDLKIDKVVMLVEERSTKMYKQMVKHMSQKSEVTHEDCVTEGKVDGQDEGPLNVKQHNVVQIRENNGYDRSPSPIYESMANQQHVMVLNELEAGELEYVSDKSGLDVDGILNMVPLRIRPIKMLHDEYSQNSGLRSSDDDNDVSDIMYIMLVKYHVHKEVDGHNHENVKADDGITDNSDDNHNKDLEDMKTLSNGVIYNNENIILDYVTHNMKLRVISKNTQSMDDMSPHNDEEQSKSEDSEKHDVNKFLNVTSDSVILRDSEDLL